MKNILKIIAISKPLHGLIFILSFLILSSSVLDLVTPILSKFIIDDIVANIQTKSGNLNHLILLIAVSFAASLTSLILTTISDRIGDHTAGELRKSFGAMGVLVLFM